MTPEQNGEASINVIDQANNHLWLYETMEEFSEGDVATKFLVLVSQIHTRAESDLPEDRRLTTTCELYAKQVRGWLEHARLGYIYRNGNLAIEVKVANKTAEKSFQEMAIGRDMPELLKSVADTEEQELFKPDLVSVYKDFFDMDDSYKTLTSSEVFEPLLVASLTAYLLEGNDNINKILNDFLG